jgi:hypothetical protein
MELKGSFPSSKELTVEAYSEPDASKTVPLISILISLSNPTVGGVDGKMILEWILGK